MNLAILGLGTALPEHAMSQARAAAVAQRICCKDPDRLDLLPTLYRQSGIETRYMAVEAEVADDVLNGTRLTGSIFLPSDDHDSLGPTTGQRMKYYQAKALPLASLAASKALQDAKLSPDKITHLVTVSCTGFAAPGIDIALMKQLNLAPTVQRTNIGFMGCHGALNGLRVAKAFAADDACCRLLVCAVELCSIHFHYGWDAKKMVGNALFSDGAAAVVGAASLKASVGDWSVTATGSCLFPDSEYAMGWTIGDHGFDMLLSTKIPSLIQRSLRPWMVSWLAQHDLSIDHVGSWAVHPGGPRVLNAVEEGLRLPRDSLKASWQVLSRCGNMSSPTVLFILEELRKQNAPRPCVALGFGPGLMAEAVLLR